MVASQLRPTLGWIGWSDDSDIVAIVVLNKDGYGAVWFNTRIHLGMRLVFVDRWARYAVEHGRRFDALRLDQLAAL